MKIRKTNYLILLLFWLFLVPVITSCAKSETQSQSSPSPTEISNNKPIIYVTNYPLRYFSEKIGGDKIQVKFPVPSDIDPAFWQPDSNVISQLQQGDLIFLNGATYEKWLDKVSLPESKLINTSSDFQDKYISLESAVTHTHGLKGEHSHTDTAFTTWLNLQFAVKQAQSIRDALSEIMPSQKETFTANYQGLEQDLLGL